METPMEILENLQKPCKVRKVRKPRRRRKPSKSARATTIGGSSASTNSTRANSNWTPKPGRELVKRPEWYWLFTEEEWRSLPPVDREQVKKIITGFTPWGDAYDLTKLFLPLDWWSEHASTRLRLLFSIDGLSEVDRCQTKDGQQVYFLLSDRECEKVRVFPVETMISTIVPRDFLML
jgi:hypothetical protein